MATLKQRLHRKNSSGTYDTIHLETSADCITGTLAIANGGTGATTAANARTNLGIFYDNTATLGTTDFNTMLTPGSYRILFNGGVNQTTYHSPYGEITSGYSTVTHYNLLVIGVATRLTQICASAYNHNRGMWYRFRHDSTFSPWYGYLTSDIIVKGLIVMWSGSVSNVPTGWALCDGNNGTPNLQDRFIVGAGSTYSPKATGGEATHKLTIAEMPSHNHNLSLSGLTTSSAGGHIHSVSGSFARIKSNQQYNAERGISYTTYAVDNGGSGFIENSGAHTHSISGSGTISNTGSGIAHNNLPPYYALCFIMKL